MQPSSFWYAMKLQCLACSVYTVANSQNKLQWPREMFLGNYAISTFVYPSWFSFLFYFFKGSASGLFISLLRQENMEIQISIITKESWRRLCYNSKELQHCKLSIPCISERILSCLLYYLWILAVRHLLRNNLNCLLKMMYCNFLLFPCTERNMSFNNASIALCASKTSLYCKIVRNDTYMKEQKVIFELLIYGPEI